MTISVAGAATGLGLADEHMSLAEASSVVPGRPDVSCVWRWCRRGVLARNGVRVRLQHIRVGGKIFTTAAWVQAFLTGLAEADTAYFDGRANAATTPPRDAKYGSPRAQRRANRDAATRANGAARRREDQRELDQELDAEGL